MPVVLEVVSGSHRLWLVVVCGGLWWSVVAVGGLWLLMIVTGHDCQCLPLMVGVVLEML